MPATSWEAYGEAKLKRRVRVDDAWVSAGKFTSPVSFGLRFDPSGEFLMEDAGGQVSVKGQWEQARSKVKFELDAAAPPGLAQTVFGGIPVGAADGTMEVDAWKFTGSIENADGTPALVWKQKFRFTIDRPDSAVEERGKSKGRAVQRPESSPGEPEPSPRNTSPIARIVADTSDGTVVMRGGSAVVVLSATASEAADGDELSYSWSQVSGPAEAEIYAPESAFTRVRLGRGGNYCL